MKTKKREPWEREQYEQSLIPAITEAERLVNAAIEHFKLTVPRGRIVVTIQAAGKRPAAGWYSPERWKNSAADQIHEINLSAEHLKTHHPGEVLLHELAHAHNHHIGVKDCTKNQTHNKKFKEVAERVGLIVAEYDEKFGYGFTELGPVAKRFLKELGFKHQLFDLIRVGKKGKEKKPGSRLRLWMCECGTKLRVAKDDLSATCNVCETLFEKQDR